MLLCLCCVLLHSAPFPVSRAKHLLLSCFFSAEFASLSATGATESDGDGKKRAMHINMDVSDSDLPLPFPKFDWSVFTFFFQVFT